MNRRLVAVCVIGGALLLVGLSIYVLVSEINITWEPVFASSFRNATGVADLQAKVCNHGLTSFSTQSFSFTFYNASEILGTAKIDPIKNLDQGRCETTTGEIVTNSKSGELIHLYTSFLSANNDGSENVGNGTKRVGVHASISGTIFNIIPVSRNIDYSVQIRDDTMNPARAPIHISTTEDIANTRKNLIKYIWKDEGFPTTKLPSKIERDIKDKRFASLSNLKRIDKITIDMDYGVSSVAYLFLPTKNSTDELIIYHQGHDGDFVAGKDVINFFLSHNYSVLAFSMPLMGQNSQPVIFLNDYGSIKLNQHDFFKYIDSDNFSSLKFFVEPIAVSLNYIDSKYDFHAVHMTGISGGGWTTVLYSALDTRVTRSYPVAGSWPLFLFSEYGKPLGDYEQSDPGLYSVANYLDMYVMGASGKGRGQLQIFNEFDSCCFAGDKFKEYNADIQQRVKDTGEGGFDAYLDLKVKQHTFSKMAMNQILADLKDSRQ